MVFSSPWHGFEGKLTFPSEASSDLALQEALPGQPLLHAAPGWGPPCFILVLSEPLAGHGALKIHLVGIQEIVSDDKAGTQLGHFWLV